MNVFKRAVLTIKRQPGKSIILFSIVFILGVALSGAILTRNAILATEERLMMQTPALATIELNLETAAEEMGVKIRELGGAFRQENQPSVEEISAVGQLPYIRAYDFVMASTLFSRELQWAEIEIDEERLPTGVYLSTLMWTMGSAHSLGGHIELFHGRGVYNPSITDIGWTYKFSRGSCVYTT